MVAGITGPAIVSPKYVVTPSLSSRLEFKLKLIWWNLNWIVSPNRPNRLNQRRLRCISRVKNTAQRLKYSRMFDIIMVLWEGIYFEMQRLLCRKVILATGWYCGSSKKNKIFMQWWQLQHQSLVLWIISIYSAKHKLWLKYWAIILFLFLMEQLQQPRNRSRLLTTPGFIGVPKTEFQ